MGECSLYLNDEVAFFFSFSFTALPARVFWTAVPLKKGWSEPGVQRITDVLGKDVDWVVPGHLLKLNWGVLVEEFFD
jgi:hypothetical protein